MNATMSTLVIVGVAGAAYGTYYYYNVYLAEDEAGQASLFVVNNSTKTLKIWVDNTEVGTVSPGASTTFEIAAGEHVFKAGEVAATITITQTIPLGTTFTWTLTD
ncbi:hypothetical protein J7K50_07300 [bacterium]|nr:hypothetical protein [bacterium]